MSMPFLQEIIKEPSQSRAQEVESEGRKPVGGQGADVRSGGDHHHAGQDERYRHKHSKAFNHFYLLYFVFLIMLRPSMFDLAVYR